MSFEFVCLGTGCPVATPERMGPSHLVIAGDTKILIDCGSGVTQRLVQAGTRGADLDALIVTHYHSDHVIDFWQLIVSSWHQGRSKPWRVIATAPAIAHMQKQIDSFADEIKLRIAHEHRPSSDGLRIVFEELLEAVIPMPGVQVTAFAVDHRPVTPAYGLVFESASRKLVFSGDTAPCATLSHAARDADLLVQEVFVDREMQPVPGVRSAETVASVMAYHTTPSQVAQIANESRVRALMLTHIVPPAADRSALLREIRAGYAGPALVGEDLMRFDLVNRIVRKGTTAVAI